MSAAAPAADKSVQMSASKLAKHRSRKRMNVIALTLSLLAMGFGLFWLAWILFETIRLGIGGLALSVFTEMTPPPLAETGGLAIFRAFAEEELVADTNAEQWRPLRDSGMDRRFQFTRTQGVDSCASLHAFPVTRSIWFVDAVCVCPTQCAGSPGPSAVCLVMAFGDLGTIDDVVLGSLAFNLDRAENAAQLHGVLPAHALCKSVQQTTAIGITATGWIDRL